LALLIGNGNYKMEADLIQSCKLCYLRKDNYRNLDMKDSISRLKMKLEEFGYLVLSFVDLKEDQFIRVIKYFRSYLDTLDKRCSILVYVGGHGFHTHPGGQDYLVPVDHMRLCHENGHSEKRYLCSLKVLLENFAPKDDEQIHLDCLWDLCRIM
jgi:hypothetical protein